MSSILSQNSINIVLLAQHNYYILSQNPINFVLLAQNNL